MLSTLFITSAIGLFSFIKDEVLWYEYLLGILGGILLSSSLYLFVTTFMIHYYRKGLPTLLDKWLFRILLISIPSMMVSLFIFLDGWGLLF